MNLLNRRSDRDALFRQPHLASKSAMRLPRCAVPRRCLLQHLINLFQAQAPHLRHQEEGKDNRETAQ
jgi:hypothetical protein